MTTSHEPALAVTTEYFGIDASRKLDPRFRSGLGQYMTPAQLEAGTGLRHRISGSRRDGPLLGRNFLGNGSVGGRCADTPNPFQR